MEQHFFFGVVVVVLFLSRQDFSLSLEPVLVLVLVDQDGHEFTEIGLSLSPSVEIKGVYHNISNTAQFVPLWYTFLTKINWKIEL